MQRMPLKLRGSKYAVQPPGWPEKELVERRFHHPPNLDGRAKSGRYLYGPNVTYVLLLAELFFTFW